ncbi:DNA-binding transcriptional repressor YgbI [Serratia rhizosphaerae]|uniref:DNA-binding transcriptional repressor YgbI n=1 Tax=unclassified Serratia (in: enterobacteria) TaxID=2647522 RepID=UPI000CF7174B|nr:MULTISPECIES: DNA-binding transcriptional repressor YgbI [unclassified Serratia (in: enterobacteria)]MBU3891645.1 DeoR/GlpR family DNA-binding transcription regulator [Serratia rubidaea]AVJ16882.1 DeoR family transcriptional regulator [Serratia sp. MYb239]MCA4823644.1 DeoR/GlpR family DNA-binding transcription regulator [Serratia rubidaea]QNK31194.1 DeoR/GlpR transcriptional regulator [Serratia sp. JUb9]QPT14878.1 DeoR/GlpR transcriptional regulator [Serratia rubidaea]
MIPVERHQQILALVAERGVVSIAELTERLAVSHMTIRRDLQKLEEQGAVIAVSGGVQAAERLAIEPSHQDKEGMFSQQKAAIGALAASLIPANSCIYLDAGTTTLALAKQIGERGDLTVVTNDFVIAAYLLENSQCELIHTGGTVCRENRSCVGEAAAQALRQLFIDLAFISASSWSMRGLSTPSEDKVAVKKAIVDASRRRILLSDTSKYGKVATYLALPIAVFDAIITDSHLPDTAQTAIQQANITLHMTGE